MSRFQQGCTLSGGSRRESTSLTFPTKGVSYEQTVVHMQPRMAMNLAQHKIINLLKTFSFCSSVFISVCLFNVWPKTTLLPVWPRDAKSLVTPSRGCPFPWLTSLFCFQSQQVQVQSSLEPLLPPSLAYKDLNNPG